MKALALFAMLLAPLPGAFAAEYVIVGWDQSWHYFHPMGTDPNIADPSWNITWFNSSAPFGPATVGDPGDLTSNDTGTGTAPLGYGAMDYFSRGGAEFTAYGTTLTTPASNRRGAVFLRTSFTLPANGPWTNPRVRTLTDDGALFYLDGALIARVNMTTNTEGWNQPATDITATLNETGSSFGGEGVIQNFLLDVAGAGTQADSFVVLPTTSLAAGSTHTLAVSVHSNFLNSSDLGFALELRASYSWPIVPGNATLAVNVGAAGKLTVTSMLALATGGDGPLSISGVQSSATAGGGTAAIAEGWVIYRPAAGFTGADSFTYTLTDEGQTVSGTVQVFVSTPTGSTMNITGFTPEGAGNRITAFAIPGRTYRWELSPDLLTWSALGTPAACPANGSLSILDPGPLPPARFYRLVESIAAPP